jgi:hypothetical protein
MNPETLPVIVDSWTESESGWGQRPDGYSLHLNKEAHKAFVKAYWDSQPKGPTPAEYSRPDHSLRVLDVTLEAYQKLKQLEGEGVRGIRIWKLDQFTPKVEPEPHECVPKKLHIQVEDDPRCVTASSQCKICGHKIERPGHVKWGEWESIGK